MPAAFFETWLDTLQEWVDDLDISRPMLTSWVAMAEERFNNELRVLEMVSNRSVMLADQCVPLPDDWLEIISCRDADTHLPLRYVSSDEYFRLRSSAEYYLSGPQTTAITYLDPSTGAPLGPLPKQPAFIDYPGRGGPRMPMARNCYTYLGRTLYVHPTVATPSVDIDPTEIMLTYYAKLPPLVEAVEPTPLFKRAPKLYTYGTLTHSAPYLVEDQRAQMWDANTMALIQKMNEAAMTGQVASSPITVQIRSFG